ncbi:hypothetical protein IFR05_001431 [Cadophora sp. M221]|nr:hypothetical protein IFR05_001431 [Cadophora sp. M221]
MPSSWYRGGLTTWDEFRKSEGWEESDDDEDVDYDSESDDDEWFPQAKAVIRHRIPDEDIKKLKECYHPSHRAG